MFQNIYLKRKKFFWRFWHSSKILMSICSTFNLEKGQGLRNLQTTKALKTPSATKIKTWQSVKSQTTNFPSLIVFFPEYMFQNIFSKRRNFDVYDIHRKFKSTNSQNLFQRKVTAYKIFKQKHWKSLLWLKSNPYSVKWQIFFLKTCSKIFSLKDEFESFDIRTEFKCLTFALEKGQGWRKDGKNIKGPFAHLDCKSKIVTQLVK